MGQRATEVARVTSSRDAMDHEQAAHNRSEEAVTSERPSAPPQASVPAVRKVPLKAHDRPVAAPMQPEEHKAITAGDHPLYESEDGAEITATRHHIEETRHEIADTIDAIKERLSPQHLVAEAKETVREAATERVRQAERGVSSAVKTARKAAEPTLDATTERLHAAAKGARTIGRTAATAARRQPAIVALAICGLALFWLNSRRHPYAKIRH